MRSKTKSGVQGPSSDSEEPLESRPRLSPLELSWIESLPTYKILAALLLLVFLAFANSLSGEFVFDDHKQVVNNPTLREPFQPIKAFTTDVWAFQKSYSTDLALPYYRPLFTLWLNLGYRLFGLWTPGWHLVSILLHLGVTLLVFLSGYELLRQKTLPSLTAALFAIHPIHIQAVAWVSAAPDLWCSMFFLGSFFLYLRGRRTPQIGFWLGSLFFFALSLLCKEIALSLPLIILGLEWFLPEITRNKQRSIFPLGGLRRGLVRFSGFAAVSLLYLVARYRVLGFVSWEHPFNRDVTAFEVMLTIPSVILTYLRHLVFPFHLSLLYSTDFVMKALSASLVLYSLSLVVLGAILFWFWRRLSAFQDEAALKALLFGIVLFGATLLPVLALRTFHPEYLVQDRYAYLPSVGFCMGMASLLILIFKRIKSNRLQIGSMGGLILLLVVGVIQGNEVWHDSVALWTRAVESRPQSWHAHYNLGLALNQAHRPTAAEKELLQAAELSPNDPRVLNNLGLVQGQLSRNEASMRNLQRAIQLDPGLVEAYVNLGSLQYRLRQVDLAEANFRKAASLDPRSTSALYNLAWIQMERGEEEEALGDWERLLNLTPQDAEARWQMGRTLKLLKRTKEAQAQWKRALQDAQNDDLRRRIQGDLTPP